MKRFDLVVANCNRCELFWESIVNLEDFDVTNDRIVFMDCSDKPYEQLSKSLAFIESLNLSGLSFSFYHRRNWNWNHGAQLDYLRLIGERKIESPSYVFFMQDHYLNTAKCVSGDTIPSNHRINLSEVENILNERPRVYFCSRYGFRVSASVPEVGKYISVSYGVYNSDHHDGSHDVSFVIDGGNFAVNPEFYIRHYQRNKRLYTAGNGCYSFCHVWETRLSKILYDQNLSFYEGSRNEEFSSVSELKSKYSINTGYWEYFYHFPLAYFLYGSDITRYSLLDIRVYFSSFSYFRSLLGALAQLFKPYPRSLTIKLLWASKT